MSETKKNTIENIVSGLSGIAGIVSSAAQNATLNTEEADNAIEAINTLSVPKGSLDTVTNMYNNQSFAKSDWEGSDFTVSTKEGIGNIFNAGLSGINAGSALGVPGAIALGGAGMIAAGTTWLDNIFKAKSKANTVNRLSKAANQGLVTSTENAIADTIEQDNSNFMKSLLKYGGPLFNHGGDWSNGLTFINEGGLHEDNPLGGVPVGMDSNFTPNLVEEGEIIWNDYVFSNRLKPTKKQLETIGFDTKYEGYTFAKIVEDVQKASAENPLDKISTDTLNENLMYLMTMQEEIRIKKEAKKNSKNMFPFGGDLDYIEEDITEESPEDFDFFWGAAKTPEQRLAIMELDPTNAYQKPKQSDKLLWQSALRYASPLTHGITLLNNLKKPDYSNADKIESAAREIPGGSFTPIGDYLDLQEIDRNLLVNPILANAAANRRVIQNQGLNAGQAIAGLAANNYNTNNAIGNALIQGIQANNQIKSAEAQFNRGTNQANAQMELQSLVRDQQRAQNILNATVQAGQLRDQLDAIRSHAISSSLTGIADDLGSIGREFMDRDLMEKLISSDALKWSSKNGGMLTRRRK